MTYEQKVQCAGKRVRSLWKGPPQGTVEDSWPQVEVHVCSMGLHLSLGMRWETLTPFLEKDAAVSSPWEC